MIKKRLPKFASHGYSFRDLRISDFFQLHRMYDSLSNTKTKQFFSDYWLGLHRRSFKWHLAQVPLFLSTIRICRRIMINLYPYITILSTVAERNGVIVAYGFLLTGKHFVKDNFFAELGIIVQDNHQGRGVGLGTMKALIEVAKREKMKKIFLIVRIDNLRAQKLYGKLGFNVEELLEDEVEWRGKKYDVYRMSLKI